MSSPVAIFIKVVCLVYVVTLFQWLAHEYCDGHVVSLLMLFQVFLLYHIVFFKYQIVRYV